MRRFLVFPLATLSIVGALGATCGPDSGIPETETNCEAGSANSEQVQLGRIVSERFEPFGSEVSLPLEFGSQGGQHVTVSVRYYSQDGAEWLHELLLTAENGSRVGGRTYVGERCTTGWTRIDNLAVFVDDQTLARAQLSIASGPYDPNLGTAVRVITSSATLRIQ